ncbi:hypothetical protein DFQ12_4287 [Sphingobacterium detergens]|uniref:Uncharacterized protein n=1 Tax=Sphingobacterium detergens TaxID=1145106 RepID=A0A420ARM7_SPHD1|nr:hypothetical protein DFQ12_4287 [Sphingobacterium detergens]
MKITEVIPLQIMPKLPVSFVKLSPIKKEHAVFVNKYVYIERYKSHLCSVYPPFKPISKLF